MSTLHRSGASTTLAASVPALSPHPHHPTVTEAGVRGTRIDDIAQQE
jgi:hypothetical protein